jgi:DNA-binding GntR family transcriptional regulator
MVDALNEHKAILAAIKSNNSEQAERAMTTHMQTAERRLLNSISHQQDSSGE